VVASAVAGVAGGLFVYFKAASFRLMSRSPARSIALMMVLLAACNDQRAAVGAVVYTGPAGAAGAPHRLWRAVRPRVIVLVLGVSAASPASQPACGRATRRDGMTVLSVRDLQKSFGGVQAVAGVSFDVAAASCCPDRAERAARAPASTCSTAAAAR